MPRFYFNPTGMQDTMKVPFSEDEFYWNIEIQIDDQKVAKLYVVEQESVASKLKEHVTKKIANIVQDLLENLNKTVNEYTISYERMKFIVERIRYQ